MEIREIEDFLNRTGLKTSRKQSKLEPFRDEIFELKKRGYSQAVILQFLQECKNIEISQQGLNYFIRSRSQAGEHQEAAKTSQVETNLTKKPPLKKGIKKFDWKNASSEGLI